MNDTEKINNQKKNSNNYYYPAEKSHWEKYQLYYLVFGSFFFTTLIVLISNSKTNKQIRKINERLDEKIYSSYYSSDLFGLDSSSKMRDYLSRLKNEPFPDYVKERVKEEIGKIQRGSFSSQTKENREEWVEQVMSFP